jgi:hypothetical protein
MPKKLALTGLRRQYASMNASIGSAFIVEAEG